MTKASDNAFPSLLITEGTEPSAPAAGKQRLYIDSTSHHLMRTNSSGTETDIEAAAGGVAADTIWDAAGDLAVGSGANTAAKLSLGNVGGRVSRINGAVAWDSGTSNPTAVDKDRAYRSDLKMEIVYDGTRWLMPASGPVNTVIECTAGTLPYSVTTTGWRTTAPYVGLYDLWLEQAEGWAFVSGGGSALSGSHKWVFTVAKQPAGTTIATFTLDSGSSSVFRSLGQQAIGALLGTTNFEIDVTATKTGTPGTIFAGFRLWYRAVIT